MGEAVDRLLAKLAGPADESRDDHGRWTAGGSVPALAAHLKDKHPGVSTAGWTGPGATAAGAKGRDVNSAQLKELGARHQADHAAKEDIGHAHSADGKAGFFLPPYPSRRGGGGGSKVSTGGGGKSVPGYIAHPWWQNF